MKLTELLIHMSYMIRTQELINSGHYELITVKVKTGLVTGGSERIAFSIVRVDVRYPDGIVGIVLQYGSSNKIYLYIYTIGLKIQQATHGSVYAGIYICTLDNSISMYNYRGCSSTVPYGTLASRRPQSALQFICEVCLQEASELRLYWEHSTVRICSIFGIAILYLIYTKAILTPQRLYGEPRCLNLCSMET